MTFNNAPDFNPFLYNQKEFFIIFDEIYSYV